MRAGEPSSPAGDIEHRGYRLGERAPAWRERNQRGWSGIIPTYVAACTG